MSVGGGSDKLEQWHSYELDLYIDLSKPTAVKLEWAFLFLKGWHYN
ncbi:hypothetical protein LX73_0399 [Fodinibius salinus]|uniref:Uncharacterized protein n=1 Tax=Fodinibius salinus TaxID=860790 RepID=A0A5D3YMF3_9BACT|nr:hypothetical protein LX73_0399 [Fodinibius salinus]